MDDPRSKREHLLARYRDLELERSSWDAHWRDIAEFQQPRLSRFFAEDANRGDKRHRNIIDNTALLASRTLAAGMMSGMTSPARPWFRYGLGAHMRDVASRPKVKAWLHKTTELVRAIFASSNTYNTLHGMYEEIGLFATTASVLLPDYENVIHHYPMTIGEYVMATDDKGAVTTLGRKVQMTVGQMVKRFGKDACSPTTRILRDQHKFDAKVLVYHIIEPREQYDPKRKDGKNRKFASVYFEPGRDDWDNFLRESGYDEFPAITGRWAVTGNDVYGSRAPGMETLGDVKQLQHQQLRKGQAIDYQVNPPLVVPTAYKGSPRDRLPGGTLFADVTTANGIRSAFEVQLDLGHLREDIIDIRDRIRSGWYNDLFLMLASMDPNSKMTATEVAERHEEKLLMLGPVLERMHYETLSRKLDLTFSYCAQADLLPEPPEEIQGQQLQIEFISVLAQAQRAVAASSADRLLGTVSTLVPIWPEARHKIRVTKVIDDYADMYGVNPEIVASDEDAAASAQAEAKQAALAMAAEAAPKVASAAKDAAEVGADGMDEITNMFSGYSSPAPSQI